jgi:hypothetical protein
MKPQVLNASRVPRCLPVVLAAVLAIPALAADAPAAGKKKAPPKERPFTPGGKYRQGDMNRPRPPVVVPPGWGSAAEPGAPPSDAIILFDGKDLSKWQRQPRRQDPDPDSTAPKWKVENGYLETVPKTGPITTKEKFADCQIHLEWATPAEVKGSGQGRGNSGFFLVGHPEVQLLDSYQNDTYPDGQAASIYGFYPPLVNASRPPGEWQTFDIIYIAPRLEEGKVVKPALYTVFHNGILAHHAVEVPGSSVECPISLQDHNNPIRFRNIWVRKLKGYDEP